MLRKLRFRVRLILFTAAILVNGVVSAQEGFFFDVGVDYLSRNVAGVNENFASPALLGGHAAFGYSLKRVDLSLEAGALGSGEGEHPDFNGVMPSVSGVQIPLTFRTSVNILPPFALQLRPEVSASAVWTDPDLRVRNYAYTEEISDWSFIPSGGVRLSYSFGNGFVALYAGFYIDYRFDMEDFANVDKQSSNFQVKGGVTIHPRGNRSAGRSGTRTRTRTSGTRSVVPYGGQIRTYTPPPTDMPDGGMDGLLLNALRDGQIQTGSTVDSGKLLSALRQDGASQAEPVMADSVTAEQPKIAQAPTVEPQTAAVSEQAIANQEIPAVKAEQAIANQEIPAVKTEQAVANQEIPAAKAEQAAANADLERQRQEIAAMKAEIEKQKAALAAENTSVVRSTTTVKQYTLEDKKLDTIYYGPEETRRPVIYSVPTLDAIGKKLKENEELMVTVRGYSAPAGTEKGQYDVSEKRAKYCADYLINRYSIQKDRIVIEWYGASRKPETANGYEGLTLERAVELILSPRAAQISRKN